MSYVDFLKSKRVAIAPSGFEVEPSNPYLFPFQRDLVRWALKIGKAAIWADCGLGKSLMELSWAQHVVECLNAPVLILAPLSVSHQTAREGEKFGIPCRVVSSQAEVDGPGIYITNYEKLHHFDPSVFSGVVLDESSCLKSFTSVTRNALIIAFVNTLMKLCCSATPAPNDWMELGNHSEFLGVLTRTEMLSTFFVHDGGDTSKWRLKGHAQEEYWRWMCGWAVMMRKPSDLGYDDTGFVLPPLNYHHHIVKSVKNLDGFLFSVEAQTLLERRGARKDSLNERVTLCAELARESDEQFVIWCGLNVEQDSLAKLLGNECVSIYGSLSDNEKEFRLVQWLSRAKRILISKVSIFGWGLNLQQCANIIFLGISDSFEEMYQGVRRCWRFGQKNEVNCHVITSKAEGAVVRNIQRKEADATRMAKEMVKHMSVYNQEAVRQGTARTAVEYKTQIDSGNGWEMRLGDCVELIKDVADESVRYSIFSPPFASLYTYSASERDMGNARTHNEFYNHFQFLVAELYRALVPGRLLSFHCMNLPTSKERDGVIGISDFRGDLIRAFQAVGFIYHSEVVIWKNPVTVMQRTKALGLLHKQLVKDSCMSRQGIPDYLVTMRKPGENPERVTGLLTEYVGNDLAISNGNEQWNPEFPRPTDEVRNSINIWQRYASPVWMDINPSDTLQKESAREGADERHICPLQLQVIRRGIELWTNPDDLVLDPFSGIGSTGYVALQQGRRFIGFELKESYYKQAVANLRAAEMQSEQVGLFAGVEG